MNTMSLRDDGALLARPPWHPTLWEDKPWPQLITRLTVPFRLAAWVFIAVLVLLTIAPPSARPDSGVPHHLEHFASFFIAGALWFMGYPRRLLLCVALAVPFAGGLELLQILVPGRHARLIDFAVDALGAWSGSVAAFAFVGVLALGVSRINTMERSSKQAAPVRSLSSELP